MRIAVWHNLPSGGGKRALYEQVQGLLARGHQIEVWCPPTADPTYLPLRTLVQEHVVPLEFNSDLPQSFFKRLRPMYWDAATRLRAMDRHCEQCAMQINKGGFDLLFAASCIFFRTTSIGRFTEIPSVLYLQEPYRWLYESLPVLPWLALSWTPGDLVDVRFWRRAAIHRIKLRGFRIQAREERRNALAFDQILVNSYFSRESVLRAYGINSKVCYLGVDVERFQNRNHVREPVAVSIGGFTAEKNADLIVRSLALVPIHLRPKLVWIANVVSSDYYEKIRRFAEANGVHFELSYNLRDDEIVDILNRAYLMLYAPRLEPFGYAPLEANACGLPVIAVAEGGVRETIQDNVNGLLVEHDPQNMALAIEKLLRNHELARWLGEQGCNLVQDKWSLCSSIQRLENQLETVVKN